MATKECYCVCFIGRDGLALRLGLLPGSSTTRIVSGQLSGRIPLALAAHVTFIQMGGTIDKVCEGLALLLLVIAEVRAACVCVCVCMCVCVWCVCVCACACACVCVCVCVCVQDYPQSMGGYAFEIGEPAGACTLI